MQNLSRHYKLAELSTEEWKKKIEEVLKNSGIDTSTNVAKKWITRLAENPHLIPWLVNVYQANENIGGWPFKILAILTSGLGLYGIYRLVSSLFGHYRERATAIDVKEMEKELIKELEKTPETDKPGVKLKKIAEDGQKPAGSEEPANELVQRLLDPALPTIDRIIAGLRLLWYGVPAGSWGLSGRTIKALGEMYRQQVPESENIFAKLVRKFKALSPERQVLYSAEAFMGAAALYGFLHHLLQTKKIQSEMSKIRDLLIGKTVTVPIVLPRNKIEIEEEDEEEDKRKTRTVKRGSEYISKLNSVFYQEAIKDLEEVLHLMKKENTTENMKKINISMKKLGKILEYQEKTAELNQSKPNPAKPGQPKSDQSDWNLLPNLIFDFSKFLMKIPFVNDFYYLLMGLASVLAAVYGYKKGIEHRPPSETAEDVALKTIREHISLNPPLPIQFAYYVPEKEIKKKKK